MSIRTLSSAIDALVSIRAAATMLAESPDNTTYAILEGHILSIREARGRVVAALGLVATQPEVYGAAMAAEFPGVDLSAVMAAADAAGDALAAAVVGRAEADPSLVAPVILSGENRRTLPARWSGEIMDDVRAKAAAFLAALPEHDAP